MKFIMEDKFVQIFFSRKIRRKPNTLFLEIIEGEKKQTLTRENKNNDLI